MTVLSVCGTRPEAIKLAPVIRELKRRPGIVAPVCVTAQHREMLDQVLELFEVRPDWDLALMRSGQSLFDITSSALVALEGVLGEAKPDAVLVQGDTTSAFVGSLAAFYMKIPVGHVEAGLRTGDKHSPFPEEMNRRLADVLSDLYFAPTERARQALLAEGVAAERIFVTGNTVVDALLWAVEKQADAEVQDSLERRLQEEQGLVLDERHLVLVTGHRRESFGPGFEGICKGLRMVAENAPDVRIVYPVHLNPNVQEPVRRLLGGLENVQLIKPVDYALFVYLMSKAHVILTDSGGIQEEAPSLGKPVLVMREKTERPEAVEAGTARLVGTDSRRIYEETERLLSDSGEHNKMARTANPFGDGKAAERIVDALVEHL